MQKKYKLLIRLLVLTTVLILVAGYGAYAVAKEKNPDLTAGEFFGINPLPSWKSLGSGMAGGVIFGFIDNSGLLYSGKVFNAFMPNNKMVADGLSNTYTNVTGTLFGTLCGSILMTLTHTESYPLWSESLGIVIGCLLGLFIPKLLFNRTKLLQSSP
jgi:hypothetical protein